MKTIKVAKGTSFRSRLIALRACAEAVAWVERKSMRTAWRTCPKGDWMLWLAARVGVDRRQIVLAACGCARLSLGRVSAGELRPLCAIETAEAWARGDAGVSLGDVRVAADAAYAADAADAASAAYAA